LLALIIRSSDRRYLKTDVCGGGGAESCIRCPSGPPCALAAASPDADALRPYICDGGGTGYGVRRDTDEEEEADEADKEAVLALAARARADAALMSLDDAF
jgi:hypothetical protein